MNVRIKFLGGARTVTGSKYLLEIDDYRLMIDCGLFQGLKDLRLMNWEDFPVDPTSINAIIITHAHIDHTGYLPRLVKQGFSGDVYCTEATASLMDIMLKDSAKLQEEEAEWAAQKGYSKHENPQPLYNTSDAEKALSLLNSFSYDNPIAITNDISLKFFNAGHILGSAFVQITLHGAHQKKKIVFSGDIGRGLNPILYPPDKLLEADILLVESTYGNRDVPVVDTGEVLAQEITQALEREGCILIPAFAVGRTQLLMYWIHKLMQEGKIPQVPVYVDSPMAINATEVYKLHSSYHRVGNDPSSDYSFCNFPGLQFIKDQDRSNDLNAVKKNAIIISASGMCTGGRILHHLYYRLPRKNDTVLFVGYQAMGTRGRRILNGESKIKIFGIQVAVESEVREIRGLSAHADRSEITSWLSGLTEAPKKTFVVHGEDEVAQQFSKHIENELGWSNVIVPNYLESFELFDNI